MTQEQIHHLYQAAFAVGFLLFGGSLLVAVINLGTQIASFWFLLVVQVVVGALLLVIVVALIGKLAVWTIDKFADLYEKHYALAKEIKKRTPWFVVMTVLVAQAVIAIADKSFQGNELPTVAVTLVLILLFFLANELIERDQLLLRVIGFSIWFLAVIALPLFVALDRGFDWARLYQQTREVPLSYRVFYGLIALVFLFTPLLFIRKRA